MTDRTECNGWSNYPTWAVALWFDSTMSSQQAAQDWAWEVLDVNDGDKAEATYDLSCMIAECLEVNAPSFNGMYADLFSYALEQVNHMEIAEEWINDNYEEWRETNND